MHVYNFTKVINREQLEAEIRGSDNIYAACHAVTVEGEDNVKIYMKAELDTAQEIALSNLVNLHVPVADADLVKPVIATLVENEKVFEKGIELTYRMLPIVFDIPASINNNEPFAFPMFVPCNFLLLGGTIDLSTNMIGDSIAIDIPAPITVGVFTDAINIGESHAHVDSLSASYLYKGMDILVDGNVIGRIKKYDSTGFEIHGAFTQAYPAGTLYQIRYRILDPYLVTSAPLTLWISRDTDRGTVVDASTPMAFYYYNASGTAKKVQICMEHYV